MFSVGKKHRQVNSSNGSAIGASERASYALKLDYNELPHSPAWSESEDGTCPYALNRYPDEENKALPENIARAYSLPVSEVAVTHGIDEAFDRFIQLFPKHSFVLFMPTFHGFMERLSANSSNVRFCNLASDFSISPADLGRLSKRDVVVLASPNNPTGHLFSDSEIEKLLEAAHAVLVDETYIDFSSSKGWLSKRPDRMFVFRSFSKSFGLAGLRAGFLVGPRKEMEEIRGKQWFCNMSSPVISAINQALASDWHFQVVAYVIQERERVTNELRRMRFEVVATETNFILLKDTFGVINEALEQNGIRVKHLTSLGMPGYLRITVDTTANNDLVLKALIPLSLAHPERQEEYPVPFVSAA